MYRAGWSPPGTLPPGMDLYEYQGKELFGRFGIPVSAGRFVTSPADARQAAQELGCPVVVKAQVHAGGRGKAGGIKLAATPAEAEQHAERILGMDIRGHTVHRLWVEKASEIAKEYYLSVTFDRGEKKPLFMLTTEGGIDIEEVAARTPGKLARLHVDPLVGFHPFQARWLCFTAEIRDPDEQKQVIAIIGKLYEAFVSSEAMLCEINPLIVTPAGDVRALDAKVSIDDNALNRHPDLAAYRDLAAGDPQDRTACARPWSGPSGRSKRRPRRAATTTRSAAPSCWPNGPLTWRSRKPASRLPASSPAPSSRLRDSWPMPRSAPSGPRTTRSMETKSELTKLEASRQQLQDQVDTLTQWVEEHRAHLSLSLQEALARIEQADLLSPPPATRGADVPASRGPSSRPPESEGPGLPAPSPGSDAGGPATAAWQMGSDAQPAEGDARPAAARSDGDPYFAELRRAVDQPQPLGPRDEESALEAVGEDGGDQYYDPDAADGRRLGGRLRRRH